MKAISTISTRPKLNAAFKVVQPLPVLPKDLPVDLRHAAAPRLAAILRTTPAAIHSAPVAAHAIQSADEREGRSGRLAATAALAGIAQACVALPELPAHGSFSSRQEVRLVALAQ